MDEYLLLSWLCWRLTATEMDVPSFVVCAYLPETEEIMCGRQCHGYPASLTGNSPTVNLDVTSLGTILSQSGLNAYFVLGTIMCTHSQHHEYNQAPF